MKKVAFIVAPNANSWLGGVTYLRNLLTAVIANDERTISPVILVHPSADRLSLENFPNIEVISTPLASENHVFRRLGRKIGKYLKRDLSLEFLLGKLEVEVLSHASATGRSSKIRSIVWIPDFQHIRMPEYFSAEERIFRDLHFGQLIEQSNHVIVSSREAQIDLENFKSNCKTKSSVLNFVSSLTDESEINATPNISDRFGLIYPYFHLPNQFWMHKNHAVVIEALSIMKNRGKKVLVVATGSTSDYRSPSYFNSLMDEVKRLGVEESFRVLGVVSQLELKHLMINSIAVINPSLFEGWSTTVEEAKSLGLSIVLSNIPVHIEQAPAYGHYFDPKSAENLAHLLECLMERFDPAVSLARRTLAKTELPHRVKHFGISYERIVQEAIQDC